MTHDEALAYWYARTNYEVTAAAPADLKLERMRAFLARLGDPHHRVRTVHVTGTKGKGSTSAMLAAILRAAGFRVGLFTSPHLVRVEERIRVDGVPISGRELAALMDDVAAAAAGLAPPPTFFEIGTALGFLHFVRRRCDFAVVEVGLGGRFDSTNVCRPLVAVVTSVGLDHTAQLGNTLEAIAFEKAGIIKPGVPAVSGVTEPGPRGVVRRAAAGRGARLLEAGRDFPAACDLPVGLLGRHQKANAAVAVAAVGCLRAAGVPVPGAAVRRGLAGVKWPARVEVVGRDPVRVLDCAHNAESAAALVETLRESFPGIGRAACVFAVSADKPFPEMLAILSGYFDHFHLTKFGLNPRGVPPEELAPLLPHGRATVHPSAAAAWAAACAGSDLACATGSVFLAGELVGIMGEER